MLRKQNNKKELFHDGPLTICRLRGTILFQMKELFFVYMLLYRCGITVTAAAVAVCGAVVAGGSAGIGG